MPDLRDRFCNQIRYNVHIVVKFRRIGVYGDGFAVEFYSAATSKRSPALPVAYATR